MSYDNTNSGALFKNDRKQKDTHPDYTGSVNVEGSDYWLSGWIKEKNGKKFFSLALKAKEASGGDTRKTSREAPQEDDNSDIPF